MPFLQCDFTATDNTLLQDYVANGSDVGCAFAHPTITGYQPAAVHFDGSAILNTGGTNLVATPSSTGVLSMWMRPYDIQFGNDYLLLQLDSSQNFLAFIFASSAGPPWVIGVGFQDTLGDNSILRFFQTATAIEWHHLLVAWNLDFASGGRLIAVYADDIQCPVTGGSNESGGPIIVPYDTAPLQVCATDQDTPNTTGDIADVFLWYGTNIMQSDATIDVSDRRRFIDAYGNPVDPSNALLAYGTPVVQCQGPAASFATNQGNGGALTLTGALTDASSPPSYGEAMISNDTLTTAVTATATGAPYNTLYKAAAAPGADQSVQFDAVLADPAGIVADGSSLYAVLRGSPGYKVGIQVVAGQFQAFLAIGNTVAMTVNAGATTAFPSTGFTVLGKAQGTTISVGVQRSSDNQWLHTDTTWGSTPTDAISITDTTFANADNVLVGGTWIGL